MVKFVSVCRVKIKSILRGSGSTKKNDVKIFFCAIAEIPKNPRILFSKNQGSGFESNFGIPGYQDHRTLVILWVW